MLSLIRMKLQQGEMTGRGFWSAFVKTSLLCRTLREVKDDVNVHHRKRTVSRKKKRIQEGSGFWEYGHINMYVRAYQPSAVGVEPSTGNIETWCL